MTSVRPSGADRDLIRDIALTGGDLDRLGHRRTDLEWLLASETDPSTRHVWLHQSRVLIVDAESLEVAHANTLAPALAEQHASVFLGIDVEGTAYFGHLIDDSYDSDGLEDSAESVGGTGVRRWVGLREIGAGLADRDAALVATTLALANWHASHRHCPRCGSGTQIVNAGWARQCPTDESIHFPRTDPSVIMLVRDDEDRALLGRREDWPPGWFSTLAGFVEAGESAESAVVREVAEETSVLVDPESLVYLGSQPWPFPSSLMLGYHARALDTRIDVDGEEISEARWFSREGLAAACADGTVRLPPSVSISRRLVERWYGDELPSTWARP